MADESTLTIELTADTAKAVHEAVDDGLYGSPIDVVRDALAAWQVKHAERRAALKAEIEVGLADVDAGRLMDLDRAAITRRGMQKLADLSESG